MDEQAKKAALKKGPRRGKNEEATEEMVFGNLNENSNLQQLQ